MLLDDLSLFLDLDVGALDLSFEGGPSAHLHF